MNKKPDIEELATAPVTRLFAKMVLPAVISQVILLVNNMLDRMYVGHIDGCGAESLTAVGVCAPLLIVPTAVASLIAGGSPLMTIFLGQKETEKAHRLVGSSLSFILLATTLLTVCMYAFSSQLLVLSGTSTDIMPFASSYFRIAALAIIPTNIIVAMYNFIGGQGLTRRAMFFMATAVIGNMILDPIFIFALGWGIAGAAAATVISSVVPAVLVVRELLQPDNAISLRREHIRIDWRILGSCLALGFSPFLSIVCEALTSIAYNNSLQRYGGDMAVGSMAVYSIIMHMYVSLAMGLCLGMQPIISYSFGQANISRVKECVKILILACGVSSIIIWAMIMAFPEFLIRLFAEDENIISYASSNIRLFFFGLLLAGATYACTNIFRFLGRKGLAISFFVIRRLVLTIPLVLIVPSLGIADPVTSIFATSPIVEVFCIVIALSFTYYILKNYHKQ